MSIGNVCKLSRPSGFWELLMQTLLVVASGDWAYLWQFGIERILKYSQNTETFTKGQQ